jgi:selenocysteine lyase/cysteine desulfurase
VLIAGLRAREFSRLDRTGHVYLDYTGSALYPASLVRRHARLMTDRVLGNPHSESGPSRASTASIETARKLTLELFDADPAVYDVVFTANASGAIRLLAEAFPFAAGSRLVLTADNHNSVNGLRLAARRRRGAVVYVPLDDELRGADPGPWLQPSKAASLFAFPAQSNFSGVRHPLAWAADARRRGYRVLVDAAAYAATSRLSLAEVPADFVAVSFYKLFGYPTGVGALVARRDALASLRRGYFGGGTVQFASVQNRLALPRPGAEAFEDGTPNFLAMPAVCDGLRWLRRLNMGAVDCHVSRLTSRLVERLGRLNAVDIYGPNDMDERGGTVAFNVRRSAAWLPYEAVEAEARRRGIAIRGGCFCNPGAAERAFGFSPPAARACLRDGFSLTTFRACMRGRPVGALRASVGVPTTLADVDRLVEFVESLM